MDDLALSTLQRMKVLEGLSDECFRAIASVSRLERFSAGESIFEHLSSSADVYLIASGKIRVRMSAVNGRTLTYQILPAGEMFGELAALDDRPRTAGAVAESECLLLKLTASDFRRLLADHGDFAQLVISKLARMNLWLIERLFEYHTYDVRGRVYSELLRITQQGQRIVSVTDKDLASRVGTTRENVTRIHRDLKKLGIVKRTGSELRVLDERKLQERLRDCEFS